MPLHCIAPFFIVDDLQTSLDFYQSKLGFEVTFRRRRKRVDRALISLASCNAMALVRSCSSALRLKSIRSLITLVTQGRDGTHIFMRRIQIRCMVSTLAKLSQYTASWQIPATDCGPSKL